MQEGILLPSFPALGAADAPYSSVLHKSLYQGSVSHSGVLWPGFHMPNSAHLCFEYVLVSKYSLETCWETQHLWTSKKGMVKH